MRVRVRVRVRARVSVRIRLRALPRARAVRVGNPLGCAAVHVTSVLWGQVIVGEVEAARGPLGARGSRIRGSRASGCRRGSAEGGTDEGGGMRLRWEVQLLADLRDALRERHVVHL